MSGMLNSAVAAAALLFCCMNMATAQTGPLPKVIRIVAPFGAGGGTDAATRSAAQWMQKQAGNSVVVDNRPGANGNLAAAHVASSGVKDGSVLLVGNLGLNVINQYLYKNPGFNPQDLTPIALIGETTVLVKTGGSKPFANLKQLVSAGQDHKRLTYGSWGYGSVSHIAAELLFRTVKMGGVHVPYKGGAGETNAALLSGTLDFMVDTFFPAPGQNIRILAVMSHSRSPRFPDVPTVGEQGFPSVQASSWVGLFAPTGTPPAVIQSLNELVNGAWREPDINAKVSKIGFTLRTLSVREFTDLVAESGKTWGPLMKELKIQID